MKIKKDAKAPKYIPHFCKTQLISQEISFIGPTTQK